MLKRLPYLLTLFFGLLACYAFMAARAPLAGKQYDYVTITQVGEYLNISTTPDHYERLRTKLDKTGFDGNFNLLFAKANEYEAQGYELVNNTALSAGSNGALFNYVMLRRPRQ